jgi:glutathione S-transferase
MGIATRLLRAALLVLHDNSRSLCAQRVRFLLAELGLPYERRTVPLAAERPAWHLEVNPAGGVPALVDDGLRMAESVAILRYLASRERRDDLYPTALRERATVDWLLDAVVSELRPAVVEVSTAAYGLRVGRGIFAEEPEPERVPEVLAAQRGRLETVAALLGAGAWACLDRFTLTDVAAAPMLWRFARAGDGLAPFPRLATWAAAVCGRPGWVDAVAPETGI